MLSAKLRKAVCVDVKINSSGIGPARRVPANPARSGRKQR